VGKKITIDAAADELGVSRRTVRRLISSGELRAYRIASSASPVRIDRNDLAKILKPITPSGRG
jgi:excisionase family DNA binding protein